MSDVNVRCVSLANGVLSPDLRVNYEFGLVLGVDEFRQEQLYLLEKDHLHHRALHGYGTVYGLHVTAAPPPDNAAELLITVEPGVGVDQWGRLVVVRQAQCARLGAWLAKQPPEVVASHRGAGGELRLCVVLSYDACEDALVPIPGEPCSSAESTMAPSRIRDSANLELRWAPPAMPAWRTVRRFARLLAHVRIEPEAVSDEATITALVRGLPDLPPEVDDPLETLASPPASPPDAALGVLRLPAAEAREALDRIFTIWATEVRPRIEPRLLDPDDPADGSAEAGILLSCLTFTTAGTAVQLVAGPDDTDRPFLLHTQLMQELLLLGGRETPNHEFATLQVLDDHTLRVWVHYPLVLDPPAPAALALTSDDGALAIGAVQGTGMPANVFDVITPGTMAPGARVSLDFLLDQLTTGGRPLLADIDRDRFAYIGRHGDTITVHTIADRAPAAREFVTITTVVPEEGAPRLQLWFHTDRELRLPETVPVQLGIDAEPVPFSATPLSDEGRAFSFLWQLTPPENECPPGPSLADGDQVTIRFDTDAILTHTADQPVDDPDGVPLTDVVRGEREPFVGYDGDHQIVAFAVVSLPEEMDVVREFVTAGTVPGDDGGPASLRLWFHTDGAVRLPDTLEVGRGLDAAPTPFAATPLEGDEDGFSFLWRLQLAEACPPQDELVDGDLLTFPFDTDAIDTRPGPGAPPVPLTSVLRGQDSTFVGYDRDHLVRAFTIVNLPAPREIPTGPSLDEILRGVIARIATLPFVTITRQSRGRGEGLPFILWFHLDEDPRQDRITINDELQVEVFAEQQGAPPVPLTSTVQPSQEHNVFLLSLDPRELEQLRQRALLRFVFPLENRVTLEGGEAVALQDYIERNLIKFEGHNAETKSIVSYVLAL